MSFEKLFPQRSVSPMDPPSQKPDLKSQILDLKATHINKIIASTGLAAHQWRAYHAKAVRKLGPSRYLELADLAKTGSNPQTLFSHLLKEEMG